MRHAHPSSAAVPDQSLPAPSSTLACLLTSLCSMRSCLICSPSTPGSPCGGSAATCGRGRGGGGAAAPAQSACAAAGLHAKGSKPAGVCHATTCMCIKTYLLRQLRHLRLQHGDAALPLRRRPLQPPDLLRLGVGLIHLRAGRGRGMAEWGAARWAAAPCVGTCVLPAWRSVSAALPLQAAAGTINKTNPPCTHRAVELILQPGACAAAGAARNLLVGRLGLLLHLFLLRLAGAAWGGRGR